MPILIRGSGGSGGKLQSGKVVTPTKKDKTYSPDNGFDGFDGFTVKAIPEKYVEFKTGYVTLTEDNTKVNIPSSAECEYLFLFYIGYLNIDVSSSKTYIVWLGYSKNGNIYRSGSQINVSEYPVVVGISKSDKYVSISQISDIDSAKQYISYDSTYKQMQIVFDTLGITFRTGRYMYFCV